MNLSEIKASLDRVLEPTLADTGSPARQDSRAPVPPLPTPPLVMKRCATFTAPEFTDPRYKGMEDKPRRIYIKPLDNIRDALLMTSFERDRRYKVGSVSRRQFCRAWAGMDSAEIRAGGGCE